MNNYDIEKELINAAENRAKRLDDVKILSSAKRLLADESHKSSAPAVKEKPAVPAGRRGVAVLNPFRYGVKGIAVFVAAILLLAAGAAVITWLSLSSNTRMASYYMVDLLKNTKIDMDGVAAFGITQEASGRVTQSAFNNSNKTVSTSLVTIDADNNITDIIFRYLDGSGEVTQNKIGYPLKVTAFREYTYILFGAEYYDTSSQDFFVCNDKNQTFIVHNASGKVYSIMDMEFDPVALTQDIEFIQNNERYRNNIEKLTPEYIRLEVSDGAVIMDIDLKDKSTLLYTSVRKAYIFEIAENNDMIFTDLMPNNSVNVDKVETDIYGNIFVKNQAINQIAGNVYYYTFAERYWIGSDGKMYYFDWVVNEPIRVFDENLSLTEPESDISVIISDKHFIRVYSNGYRYIPDSGYYLVNGELIETSGTVNNGQLTGFYHIDLSHYNGTNASVVKKHIISINSVNSIDRGNSKVLTVTAKSLTGTQKYQITYDGEKVVCVLESDIYYNRQIVSIQPLN